MASALVRADSSNEVGRSTVNREVYREAIGSMLEEAGRLSRLVESLLSISRADSGQVQLDYATIGLFSLIQEASLLLTELAEEKSQTLSLEGDDSVHVKADNVILLQVVINL